MFLCYTQVVIVNPVTVKDREPGGGFNVFAPVFVPFYVGFVAEDSGPFFADVGDGEEGADVEADAVVEVGVPADGLLVERFPADKDVVRIFAFEDEFKLFLEGFGGGEALFGAINTGGDILFLAVDPVAKVGVDQGFEVFVIELMIVDQSGKAVAEAVPDMPYKGAVLKELAVLGEELFAQPGFEGFAGMVGAVEQLCLHVG